MNGRVVSDDDQAANSSAHQDRLRLELEIDHDAPLEGSLSSSDGTTRSFAGWPGLATTLTAFLDDWEHQPPGPDGD